ncbi:hypothetical protein [Actinomadura macrotermitis]|uniref:Uncharacterized protein n=1 Tax=Actinomadura macrotermitis TaxID=2585200 RepID=A0A7K0C0P3_9ACTN|nr:hypothetical protein [Actinomadura macrotermitis]MQY07031.1 hypothetical protein [Actinomadura macrotermitis]
MTPPPDDDIAHDTIHLGDQTAVVISMEDFRLLSALRRHASAEALETAMAVRASRELDEWIAAGRPGELSHEEAMAELFGRVR